MCHLAGSHVSDSDIIVQQQDHGVTALHMQSASVKPSCRGAEGAKRLKEELGLLGVEEMGDKAIPEL